MADGTTARHAATIKRLTSAKNVSFLGGVCLLLNAMTGAGIPYTPSIFATLGWLPPLLLFAAFAIISAFSVLFIIEAMQALPGNRHFQGTVEFATLVHFYFGPVEHLIAQLLLYGAIQSQAMNNIVLSAQTFDNILVDIFHKTCGITLPGGNVPVGWHCFSNNNSTTYAVSEVLGNSPFGSQPILFSLGLLIVIVLCLPLAISNLDDNIQVQIVAFVMTLVVSAEWVVESSFSVKASRVPTLSVSPSFGNLLGPIIINYACTIFVPSWINLKRQNVNAQRTVWLTMTLAIFVYTLMGLFPALAFDGLAATGTNGQTSNAIANFINPSQAHHVLINKITCYAFSIVMLLPAIPVSFIVSEQNIVHNFELGGWGKWGFKFVCFVLPWLLIIPMQTGSALGSFMNWTGVLLVSPANFVIPFVIYLKCLRFRREYNEHRVLSAVQTKILKQVHMHSSTILNYLDAGARGRVRQFGRTLRFRSGSMKGPSSPAGATVDEPEMDPAPIVLVSRSTLRKVQILDWTDEDDVKNAATLEVPQPSPAGSLRSSLRAPSVESSRMHHHKNSPTRVAFAIPQNMELSDEDNLVDAPTEEFWLQDTVPDPEFERLERMKRDEGTARVTDDIELAVNVEVLHNMNDNNSTAERPQSAENMNSFTSTANLFSVHEDDDYIDVSDLQKMATRKRVGARKTTLPFNPKFVSPAFQAVPDFLPVRGYVLAVVLLTVTSCLTVAVVALQIWSALQPTSARPS